MKNVGLVALAIVAIEGVVVGAQTPQTPKPSVFAKAPACECAVFPWTPKACVTQCTARFLTLPKESLDGVVTYSSAVDSSVTTLKKNGMTPDQVELFIATPLGKDFLKALENAKSAKPERFDQLVAQAMTVKNPG